MSRFRLTAFATAIILTALGVGCLDPEPTATAPTNREPDTTNPAPPPIDVPEADLKALVEGNNQFAIELYQKLAEKHDGNIVISPYSISSALAMTYAGARGETAEQMARTLHFTLPPERLHAAFGGTTQHLQSGQGKSYRLNIANALWGQQGFSFRPEFLDVTRRNYGGGLHEVDFRRDSEGSRQTINRWVKERTAERIPELLLKPDIHPAVYLVLTNAIYFKGEWERAFSEDQTREEFFESALGVRVNVPMMRIERGMFRCHFTSNYQMLELPYRGKRVSMVFLLPTKRFGLPEIEKELTTERWNASLKHLGDQLCAVEIPRFKSRSRFDPEMKNSLEDLGMTMPFSGDADFTGITPRSLQITKVIHEADVEIDERGTTAAAATAVIMGRSAGFNFRADQPFLFLIRDRETGTILFLGRVTTPN